MSRFSSYDVFISILSTATYVIDVGTDIWLIVYFFLNGHSVWGALTLGFVAMAAVMMQVFSFHWHVTDKSLTWKTLLIHVFFLAPIHRYIRVLQLGFKSRASGSREDLESAYREVNDICILRLFETFLESAPQLVLQLYIIFSNLNNFGPVIGISTVFSLLSVSWAVTAYTDALHLAYKKFYKRSPVSMVTQTLWQTGMTTSRITAIVLFASAFQNYVAIPLGIHWIIMLAWIMYLKPEFGTTPCEKSMFAVVAAMIHTFCYLNLKDGSSRWRMMFYYSITLVENVVFVAMWYVFKPDTTPVWLDATAFSLVFGGFAIGGMCLLLYYGCCHPSGPAPLSLHKPELHHKHPTVNNEQSLKPNRGSQVPIFDVSSRSARINLWLSASLDLSKEGLVENPNDHLDINSTGDHGNHSRNHGNHSRNYGDPSHNYGDPSRNYGEHSHNYGNNTQIQSPVDVHKSSFCVTDNPFAENPLQGSAARYPCNLDSTVNISQGSRSRSHMYSSEDRLDTTKNSHARFNNTQQEQSPQDFNLVEMFARCKLDPSFVSTGSFDDLPMSSYITPNQKSLNYTNVQKSSKSNTSQKQGRRSRTSNMSHVSATGQVDWTPDTTGSHDYLPVNISPLDATKLWEDSKLTLSTPARGSIYQYESDPALHSSQGENTSPTITVLPDTSRGITHLSLSYSALDKDDMYNSYANYSSLRNSGGLSQTSSSFLYNQTAKNGYYSNQSRGSINASVPSLNRSEGVSFSNLSLQLPDSSGSRNWSSNPPDIVSCSSANKSDNNANRHNSRNKGGSRSVSRNKSKTSVTSPLERDGKNRSVDSFYSREYSPSDRQSSYLSDRGLSTSDRGLSSSGSTNDRSQRSLTSSGFQSEESNTSNMSPNYANSFLKNMNLYQSTPIVENEISSIYDMPSAIRSQREVHMDEDVEPPSQQENTFSKTPTTSKVIEKIANKPKMPQSSLFFYTEDSNIDSPVLPPFSITSRRSSSAGSSGSHRFFKDPTLPDDDENTSDHKSSEDLTREEDSTKYPQSIESSLPSNSLFMEKSSLSELLSDMSGSRSRESSEGNLSSLGSNQSLGRKNRGSIWTDGGLRKAASLPYMLNNDSDREHPMVKLGSVYPLYDGFKSSPSVSEKLSSPNDTLMMEGRHLSDGAADRDYLSSNPSELNKLQQLFNEMSGANNYKQSPGNNSDYANLPNLTPQQIKDIEDSPGRPGRSIDNFDRDRWRASLDKEMRDKLVHDMEKFAPKKLYQLRSKSDNSRKKLSPVDISDYTESPYKFRRSAAKSSDYENIKKVKNASPASLGSEYENIRSLTNAIYTDYDNIYDLSGEKMGNCPVARPESLSDSVFLDDKLENNSQTNSDKNSSRDSSGTSSCRDETFSQDSLNSDAMSRSSELSRTKSPINTSGVNSAFKPVKTKKSVQTETPKAKRTSNSTFTIFDETANTSKESLMSKTQDVLSAADYSSRSVAENISRQSILSQGSFDLGDTCNSTFQWSNGTDSMAGVVDTSDHMSCNYLQMAGKTPLSFSMSSFPQDDTNSQSSSQRYDTSSQNSFRLSYASSQVSQHSYSDSIPWEDTANKSSSFPNSTDLSAYKLVNRQPLKALENTPVFSPIYGQDRRVSIELSSRKRFMSTPKLSTGSDMSLSRTPNDSTSYCKTPQRRRSSDVHKVMGDNTSTWSSQSDSDSLNGVQEYSSLSKTTYI